MNSENDSHVGFKKRYLTAKNITYFAILLALVIVLQMFGSVFTIGSTHLNFVLVPIVLCGMVLGPVSASFLGLASGIIIYLQGFLGVDQWTMTLINDHPGITALTCLLKGFFSGFISGIAFKLIKVKNKTIAAFTASALCPIINTGLFILGALLMSDTLSSKLIEDGSSVIYYLIIVIAGVNFVIELAINLICAPAILRITEIVKKYIKRRG